MHTIRYTANNTTANTSSNVLVTLPKQLPMYTQNIILMANNIISLTVSQLFFTVLFIFNNMCYKFMFISTRSHTGCNCIDYSMSRGVQKCTQPYGLQYG